MTIGLDPATTVAIIATGVLGGIVSVLVSLASLVTYPALLAFGLPPVSANVTNTVALVFNSLGAVLGARPELVGQRPTLARLAGIAAAGGATGAGLLLVLPARWFELVVPVLVAGASLGILAQPWIRRHGRFHPRGITPATAAAYFSAAVYIGYFGAAGGVLVLLVLGAIIDRPLVHVNAAKAVLSGIANGVAALGFVVFGPVQWAYAIPLAIGLFVGGLIGPAIARRLPEPVFRGVVVLAGLGVAALLAWRTYLG